MRNFKNLMQYNLERHQREHIFTLASLNMGSSIWFITLDCPPLSHSMKASCLESICAIVSLQSSAVIYLGSGLVSLLI